MDKFSELPNDVLIYMALNMDMAEIISLCRLSSRFNLGVCENPTFWISKLKKEYNLDFSEVKSIVGNPREFYQALKNEPDFLYEVNKALLDKDVPKAKRMEDWLKRLEENRKSGHLIPDSHPINNVRLENFIQDILNGRDFGQPGAMLGNGSSSWLRKPQYAYLAREYANAIEYISYNEFLEVLQLTFDKYNIDRVKNINEGFYTVLHLSFITRCRLDKSNYWMSNISWDMWEIKPDPWICLKESLLVELLDNGIRKFEFVIIDDGVYSGQQIRKSLEGLDRTFGTFQEDRKDDGLPIFDEILISIIVPFGTDSGLRNMLLGYWVNIDDIKVYYGRKILSARERMIQLNPELNVPERRFNRPLTYFDHKVPDAVSVDYDFLRGFVTADPTEDRGFIEGCIGVNQRVECPLQPYKKYKLI